MEPNDVKAFIDELVNIRNERDELLKRVEYLEEKIERIAQDRREQLRDDIIRMLDETERSLILSQDDAAYLRDIMVRRAPRYAGEIDDDDEDDDA